MSSANTGLPGPPPHSKLIIVAFDLPLFSGHFFNELLGYKAAAEALGLEPRIFVPRSTAHALAAPLGAERCLEPIRNLAGIDDLKDAIEEFLRVSEELDYLWTIIEREDLTKVGAIIFATTHAVVVRGVALWLRKVPIDPLPPMFFRFTSQFAETPRPADSKLPYRLAAKDLSTRAGQERVFFLVNGTSMRRAVTRICARRSFMVPMSKYLDGALPICGLRARRRSISTSIAALAHCLARSETSSVAYGWMCATPNSSSNLHTKDVSMARQPHCPAVPPR